MAQTEVDLAALTEDEATTGSGVEHGELLIAFADAMVGDNDDVLSQSRDRVIQTLGPEAMVDAAGVASNFERMVRIADATGIPLDERLASMTEAVREELQLARFGGSQNMSS